MLGYCTRCQKLVRIQPGPSRSFERRCDYYPVPHDEPPNHAVCEAPTVWLEATGEQWCPKCAVVVSDEDLDKPEPCNGHKRAIT